MSNQSARYQGTYKREKAYYVTDACFGATLKPTGDGWRKQLKPDVCRLSSDEEMPPETEGTHFKEKVFFLPRLRFRK